MAGSHTNNLPTPTDLTENHYGKNLFYIKAANQKSVTVVALAIEFQVQPP
jgi:hypothetical protein